MSTRPKIAPIQVITAGNMSSNITSLPTVLGLSMFSYAFSWSGTSPVGTISIQGSNDYSLYPSGAVNNAGTWITLSVTYNGTTVTTIPVSGNTGNGVIDAGPTGLYAVQVIYTAASGTGTLNCFLNGRAT